jgi:hypothetical protein
MYGKQNKFVIKKNDVPSVFIFIFVHQRRVWQMKLEIQNIILCWLFVRECYSFFRLSSGILGFRIRLVGLLELFYGFPGYFTGFRVCYGFPGYFTGFRIILRDGSTGAGLGIGLIDLCRFEYQYREAMR